MATFDNANSIIASEVDQGFIPQLWSDEVIAVYKLNLVMANLIRKLNHRGKKGDTIYVPTPDRGTASIKAEEAQVTLIQHGNDTRVTINIDRHQEYSRLIEDFADVQALESLRRFYTDDAGYAIARAVDTDIINEQLAKGWSTLVFDTAPAKTTPLIDNTSTFVGSGAVREGDGSAFDAFVATSGAVTDVTDVGIRTYVRLLDDSDVPMMNRSWVVRPVVKQTLMGLPRFTEEAFVGERAGANTIRNGLVGDVYGTEVYVSNQLPQVESSVTEDLAVGDVSLFFHMDATVLVEQMGMRSQTQYLQQFLANLMTTDTIYGVRNLRATNIIPVVTGTG